MKYLNLDLDELSRDDLDGILRKLRNREVDLDAQIERLETRENDLIDLDTIGALDGKRSLLHDIQRRLADLSETRGRVKDDILAVRLRKERAPEVSERLRS
jgi:hypothetical protein